MSTTVEQLVEQAIPLPVGSRAKLADPLVESPDIDELGRTGQLSTSEAKRRRDEVRSGKVTTIPGPRSQLVKLSSSLERSRTLRSASERVSD